MSVSLGMPAGPPTVPRRAATSTSSPQYVFAALDASAASYRLGALARDTGA
jgi:hypothetical protein